MAGQTDFKHITVNPAEDDDIVIQAGAPSDATSRHSDAPIRHSEQSEESLAPQKSPQNPAPQSPKPASSKEYRATTLEDIQSFKMSRTQIVIIVLALAAIVAFVVWYMFFS